MRVLARLLLVCGVVTAAASAAAEQRQYGRYDVYYSLFPADFLQPEVAGALAIVRAADRAVLNIAVRKRAEAGRDTPVAATIEGTRGDLIRKVALEFREVAEDDARYYLAQFGFRNDETVYFELRIRPEGEAQPFELRFDKTLYVD